MPQLPHGALDSKTREEVAKVEIGHTDMSPTVAWFLFLTFALICCAIPLFELARAAAGDERARTPWAMLMELPERTAADWRTRADAVAGGMRARVWSAIVGANRVVLEGLHEFEKSLEDESRLASSLRPPAQRLLSGVLGAGNEQVYVGKAGWLFYRPDVEFVTAPGFLNEDVQRRRIRNASEWTEPPQPDPRRAILAFKQQLDLQGISLILMPVSVKPSIHPEMLAGARSSGRPAPQNPDYGRLIDELRQAGIIVFDSAEVLQQEARTGTPQYLATDTHWRPDAMMRIGQRLAEQIRSTVALLPLTDPGYRAEPGEVANLGDVFRMLDLPENQTLFEPETISVRRIITADGSRWRPSRDADVLVLGDSFANIYSLESMGWGTSAGLVEQLSYELRRPVDRIVQNDAGAHATREMLRGAGSERLNGKRIVIWQFAARELAFGDWKIF